MKHTEENIPLADKTTWRIGGTARYYAEPQTTEELAELLKDAEKEHRRVYILGGGSNLLITDELVEGLVLRHAKSSALSSILSVDRANSTVSVGAGVSLSRLVNTAAQEGLAGLEDLAGIPGTVGGAVFMNAGNPIRGIGSCVDTITALDTSGRKTCLHRDHLHFAYRWSNLQNLYLTEIRFRLKADDPEEVQERTASFRTEKRTHQPLDKRSAGCVFRNPPHCPAGYLIDQAGLKGFRIGGATVSTQHANFIINADCATCSDTRAVIEHVRTEIRKRHDIDLQLEIQLWL